MVMALDDLRGLHGDALNEHLLRAAAASNGTIHQFALDQGTCYRFDATTTEPTDRRLNARIKAAIDNLLEEGLLVQTSDSTFELTDEGYTASDALHPQSIAILDQLLRVGLCAPELWKDAFATLPTLARDETFDAISQGALPMPQLVWEWAGTYGQISPLHTTSFTADLTDFNEALQDVTRRFPLQLSIPARDTTRPVMPPFASQRIHVINRTDWFTITDDEISEDEAATLDDIDIPEDLPALTDAAIEAGEARVGETWVRIAPEALDELKKEPQELLELLHTIAEARVIQLRDAMHRMAFSAEQLLPLNAQLQRITSWQRVLHTGLTALHSLPAARQAQKAQGILTVITTMQPPTKDQQPSSTLQNAQPATTSARAVIITALRAEYAAVRAHLTDITEETHDQGTIYETGTFQSGDTSWQVTILEAGMGNSAAARETERAINHTKPTHALFVGIAGGLKDAQIGDVIAATDVYAYEAGKQGDTFKTRPNVGKSSYALVQRALAEARKNDWQRRITQAPSVAPTAFVGPIAAGEKVLTSSTSHLRQFLEEHYNDALAIEMEGAGFLAATYANHETESIAIRGISDLLDNKTTTDRTGAQRIAAQHASAFAFQLLATITPPAKSTPAQPAARSNDGEIAALRKIQEHAHFTDRIERLIESISKIPGHFVTQIDRGPAYRDKAETLWRALNADYEAFRAALKIACTNLVALANPANERVLTALQTYLDAITTLVADAHEVYASHHKGPREQARAAGEALSRSVAQRLAQLH